MTQRQNTLSRRALLQSTAAATGALALAGSAGLAGAAEPAAANGKAITKGNLKQSIVHWCFAEHWDVEKTCQIAKELGCQSVELVAPEHWPTLKKHGLVCALAGSHLFVQGFNNPKYHEPCIAKIRESIDKCVEFGFPTVITFTGFAADTGPWADGGIPDFDKLDQSKLGPAIDPEEGIKNCVAGLKKVIGYAEKNNVSLSLEMLNSRVGENMKGHPGYQGDHTDYCMEIIKQVGSPRLGLLFDLYHVQIMDGDIITRMRECFESINHVHTAGNPGRCEIDENQEINYAPCMKALVELGYKGYVGQEFIPTRDPLAGLTQACKICDA